MAQFLKGFLGGRQDPPLANEDADFVDFARAPDPTPAAILETSTGTFGAGIAAQTASPAVLYTKWYRVWERTSPKDFYQEAFILPLLLAILALHLWGRGKNRRKAQAWAKAHEPVLRSEFAVVGFNGSLAPAVESTPSAGLAQALSPEQPTTPSSLLKERTACDFITYATGRQNVAFADFQITLIKRFNPLAHLIELLLSLFMESAKAPAERAEATLSTFDGREKELIAAADAEPDGLEIRAKGLHSSYDGFVWALVNKDLMRKLRDDRYDISLTYTKDHPKLPSWATVMSESAEVTDMLLTPELLQAVEQAGDAQFEHLIITDQPTEKPVKLSDTVPKKRISLSTKLSSDAADAYDSTMPLFSYFLRLPDILVASAHFRPEVMRRVRATREEEARKLRKADDEEKAEERKAELDKKKKHEREAKLKGLSADEQRKFLDKEREKDQKKMQKKMSRKG